MGMLFTEGAITVEGPLTQGVNRGISSRTKGSSGSDSLLEVWPGAFMLQLYTKYFCSFFTFFICCFFRVVCLLLLGICCAVS